MIFTNLAIDDISSNSLRLGEPSKLFIILSTLIRCFDVSKLCQSKDGNEILRNPSALFEPPISPMPDDLIEIIYKRENLLKKILEDSNSSEDSARLLQFLLWENPDVTLIIFNEIVGLVRSYLI